jgi:hypothetical protein
LLQIFNEAERLAQGRRLKIHCLTKATASSNSFGPNSSQRFDVLIATPLRLVGMIKSGAIDLAQCVRMPPGQHSPRLPYCDVHAKRQLLGFRYAGFGAVEQGTSVVLPLES